MPSVVSLACPASVAVDGGAGVAALVCGSVW